MEGVDHDGEEQVLDLVAGQRDQSVRVGVSGVFVRPDDGEEGVGEHGEGDPAAPGRVAEPAVLTRVLSGTGPAEWQR